MQQLTDKDYAALVSGLKDAGKSTGIALCTDEAKPPDMDNTWISAQ